MRIIIFFLLLFCSASLHLNAQKHHASGHAQMDKLLLADSLPPIIVVDTTPVKTLIFPLPVGHVNDFEHDFTAAQIHELDSILLSFDTATSNHLVLVTTDSIVPFSTIADYAMQLFDEWGIGMATKNNGLLIVFSKQRKEIRIVTGSGTEKVISNQMCKDIIDTIIVPAAKQAAYYEGLKLAVLYLIGLWH